MKTNLLLFVPLFFLAAFVSDLHAQGTGGGGGGFRMASDGCVDGTRSTFPESRGGRTVYVERTCKNGSYYDLSEYNYDPQPRCWDEGKVEQRTHTKPNGKSVPYFVYCRKGIWVRLNKVETASR